VRTDGKWTFLSRLCFLLVSKIFFVHVVGLETKTSRTHRE
jgi:hypothetical protein